MININIEITLSKILAYVVLIIGTVFAYMFQDTTVLIATFSASSAIIALKTYTSSRERQKRIEHPEPPPDYDGPDV